MAAAACRGRAYRELGPFEPLKLKPTNPAEVAEAHAVLDRFAAHQRPLVEVRSGPWRDMAVRKRHTEIEDMVELGHGGGAAARRGVALE